MGVILSFEQQVKDFITSLEYEFTPDFSKPKKQWNKIDNNKDKLAYAFDIHKLKDASEVLVFTIYDYRKQESFTEKFAGRELTDKEIKNVETKIKEQTALAQKEKERKWKECREYCVNEWEKAQKLNEGTHPYLDKKSVATIARRVDCFRTRENLVKEIDLLIPMQDIKGEFWGYQTIHQNGDKQFSMGQRLDSLFLFINGNDISRIYICEGVATGLSISEALNQKFVVVCAFSASNMIKVADALRRKYEKSSLVVCADNDKWKPHIGNTGVRTGEEILKLVDGSALIYPDFTGQDESRKPTDFNDLHSLAGIKEVARQIEACVPCRPQVIFSLGYSGSKYFFSTLRNPQIQVLSELSSTDLLKLATKEYWEFNFPKKGGIDYEAAKSMLIDKGQKTGIFEPSKIRGRGVFIDNDEIIIHRGDKILTLDERVIDLQDYKTEYFYDPRTKLNIPEKKTLENSDVEKVENILKDISFEKPTDYKLFMGWLFVAPLAGLLEWRPNLLICAGAGTGKSTLLNYIVEPLFSFLKPFKKENTTEAGLRQIMGPDSGIVLLDEFDTNGGIADRSRLQGLINIARVSASGGSMARGTTSGKSLQYNAHFVTFFSGVNPPNLSEADRSRITELNLNQNYKRENWNEFRNEIEKVFPNLGGKLFWTAVERAKMVNESGRVLHSAIGVKFGQRAGQQYGALLSGYWHWKNDKIITENEAKALVEDLIIKDREDNVNPITDSTECIEHLMNITVQTNKDRERIILSEFLQNELSIPEKNKVLIAWGLGITKNKTLFISSKNVELSKHFSQTVWADWTKALRRLNGAKTCQMKRGGINRKGIEIPWEVLGEESRDY